MLPEVTSEVDPGLKKSDAFTFQELALERRIGLADEEFAAIADDSMPRDAFSGRGCGHSAARGPGATAQPQDSSNGPIG